MKSEDFEKLVFEDEYQKMLTNIYLTHIWLYEKYQAIMKKYGVTLQQFNILGFLFQKYPEPVDLQSVKKILLEPNADVTRLITRLKEKNLVTSRIDPNNKRKIELRVTAAGKKLAEKINLESPSFQKEVSFKLLQSEAAELNRLLNKIRS